jgi:FkbM family methyltransferase
MVEEAGAWNIVTPVAPWSYALMMAFPGRAVAHKDGTPALAMLRAVLDTVEGEIGIGAVREDGSTYLAESTARRSQSPGSISVECLIEDCGACGYIVIRNMRPTDGRSSCTVRSVEVLVIDDPWGAAFRDPPPLRAVEKWSEYYGDRVDTVQEQLRRRGYSELCAPSEILWIASLRVWLHPGNQISRVVAASGQYEPGVCLLLEKLLPRAGVFVDAGANVGLLSLFAARCVGDEGCVYAFEPSRRDYERLTANIALNGLGNTVHSIPCALGDKPARAVLRVADNANSGHNTLGEGFSDTTVSLSTLEGVAIRTLDDFTRSAGVDRLDVMKVDVEGFETAVLRGSAATLARLRPSLLLEVSDRQLAACGSSPAELEHELRAHGYTFLSVDEGSGATVPLSSLAATTAENVLAVPSDRVPML